MRKIILSSLLCTFFLFGLSSSIFGMSVQAKQPAVEIQPCETGLKMGVSLDFLFWATNYNFPYYFSFSSVEESNLPITAPYVTENTFANIRGAISRAKQKWDPGVRATYSFYPKYDNIDVQLIGTYYHNHTTGEIGGESTMMDFFEGDSSDEGTVSLTGASVSLALKHYVIGDVELGKCYNVATKVDIRPFAGLRGGWIDIHNWILWDMTTTTTIDPGSPIDITSDTPTLAKLKQPLWLVGPRIGLNTSWFNFSGLSIIGNISGALLYGKTYQTYTIIDVSQEGVGGEPLTSVRTKTSNIKIRDHFFVLVPDLQMLLGLSWEFHANDNLSVKFYGAWEANFLWGTYNVLWLDRPISMQGFTGGISFNF